MKITKNSEASRLTVCVSGRLDTNTAPQLEAELSGALDGVSELILDFGALDYISSAGLRILLALQKRMKRQGTMKVTHVNEIVGEIFEVTGFSDILTIE